MKLRIILVAVAAAAVLLFVLLRGTAPEAPQETPEQPSVAAPQAAPRAHLPPPVFNPERDELFDDLDDDAVPAVLAGYVFDHDGEPVHNARVEFVDRDSPLRRTIYSDEEGYFTWHDAPAGDWVATAWFYGFDPSPPTPITADEEIVLELPAPAFLQGQVLYPDGEPVTNYTLAIAAADFRDPDQIHRRRLPELQVSDPSGRFQLGPLATGVYRLAAIAEGYAPTRTEALGVESGEELPPVIITLEQGQELTGRVRDRATGAPIEGARVFFSFHQQRHAPPTDFTDSSGSFALQGVPAGRGSLRAFAQGYQSELLGGVDASDAEPRPLDLRLTSVSQGGPGQNMEDLGLVITPNTRAGFLVIDVFNGSPAKAAGMLRGDVLHTLDGRSLVDDALDTVVEALRGPAGTTVELGYYRSGVGHRAATLQRARFFVPASE